MKQSLIKKQFNDTVKIQQRQYKALQKQLMDSYPKDTHKDVVRQAKEDQMRKMAVLATQYEKSIADMLEQQSVSSRRNDRRRSLANVYCQVKLDESQVKEQEDLRVQLQQEQDLLKEYQEKLQSGLKSQVLREREALEQRIKQREEQLKQRASDATGATRERNSRSLFLGLRGEHAAAGNQIGEAARIEAEAVGRSDGV